MVRPPQANGAAVELPAAAAGRGLGELHVLQEHDSPSAASLAPASASEPAAFAWLAGPGLYHGHVGLSVEPGGSPPLLDGAVLPFPRSATNPMANPPLSCALTAHHWLMLYADGVLGVNRLMGAVVETVAAPADAAPLKGLVRDGPSGELGRASAPSSAFAQMKLRNANQTKRRALPSWGRPWRSPCPSCWAAWCGEMRQRAMSVFLLLTRSQLSHERTSPER
jgi:hypothetical protein